MKTIDSFSTLVERIHLAEEVDILDEEITVWINNGAQKIRSTILDSSLLDQIGRTEDRLKRQIKLSQPEVLKRLHQLRLVLRAIPMVEIRAACDLPEEFKKTLVVNLKKTIKGNFVIKVSKNKDLIAGAQISFRGKYGDYSLIKKLSDNKEAIFGEILKDVGI